MAAAILVLITIASVAGAMTVDAVGDRAPAGQVTICFAFLAFYWSFASGSVLVAVLLFRDVVRSGPVAISLFLGVLPEGLMPLLSRGVRDSEGMLLVAKWVDYLQAPGSLLYGLFKGSSFDRFAVGLTDPPARLILGDSALLGCLNGIAWLAIVLAVQWAVRAGRR